jgi:pilus assembly protein CpaC
MQNNQIKWSGRVSGLKAFRAALLLLGGAVWLSATPAATMAQEPATRPAANIVSEGVDANGHLKLAVNKTSVLTTRTHVSRISVGQPDIADVNLISATNILVTGKKMGTTQIILWDDSDRSQVIDVVVDFDLDVIRDQYKVMFPNAKIELAALNGALALRGHVADLKTAEQAVAIASPYTQKVLNFLEISGGQQVMLQVRFAEVSRTAISNLGFSAYGTDGTAKIGFLNGSAGSPIGALAGGQAFTLDSAITAFGAGQIGNTAFEAFLSALRTNNLLRVLAEPNLTTISGQEASFLAGGQIPVPVPQNSGGSTTVTIEYKEFGVQLKFVPVVLGDGRIRMQVAPEVSQLDYSHAVQLSGSTNPIPALTTRNVSTTVELNDGQSFAIAGLLQSSSQANAKSTPILGDLPVLGALFRSVQYQRDETELVVLITPRLVAPMDPDKVPTLPGEHWRNPTEADLFWNRDLGSETPAMHRKSMAPAAAPTTTAAGPAPKFQGSYGFVPANSAPAEDASASTASDESEIQSDR